MRLSLGSGGAEAGACYRGSRRAGAGLARPAAWTGPSRRAPRAGASLILLVQAAGFAPPAGKDAGGRQARWARIAREAAKQSKQLAVPPGRAPVAPRLAEALRRRQCSGLRRPEPVDLVAATRERRRRWPQDWPRPPSAAARSAPPGVALWVGPESGWTAAERAGLLARRGWRGQAWAGGCFAPRPPARWRWPSRGLRWGIGSIISRHGRLHIL